MDRYSLIIGIAVLFVLGWLYSRYTRYVSSNEPLVFETPEDDKLFRRVIARSPPDASYVDHPKSSAPEIYTRPRCLADLQHVVYINLPSRADRRSECEQEFGKLGVPLKRVSAIKFKPGSFGCTLSHIKCLEMAKREKWPHVWINEDDVTFTVSRDQLETQLYEFFRDHPKWDMLLFHVMVGEGAPVKGCLRVRKGWCTTSYLVHAQYYDVLLNNYYAGASHLYHYPDKKQHIDEFWHSLQRRDEWYLLFPYVCQQRIGYSDIDTKEKDLITDTQTHLEQLMRNQKRAP